MAHSSAKGIFASTKSNRIMLVIVGIVVITLILDVSLARVYDLIPKGPSSGWKSAVFAIIALIGIAGQYFLLGYINQKSAGLQNVARLHVRAIHRTIWVSLLAISLIFAVLVLQTVFMPFYYSPLLIAVVSVSYGLGLVMMGLLAQKFLSWYRSNKSRVILLYALASASLAVNVGFSLAYVNDILLDGPIEMMRYTAGSMVTIMPNSMTAALNSAFFVSSVVSFAMLWAATAVLLHHHAKKLGTAKYWIVIGSPLVLFLSQFVSFFIRVLDPMLIGSDGVSVAYWTTILFTLSKPAGGALFGLAFFIIARNFKDNHVLRNYLIISACGFILLYAASQPSALLVTPFPPFGVLSVSFVGLASYLVFLGIYSSAILISEDAKLRRLVRRTSLDHSGLLDNVGLAHMQKEIEKRVRKVMKENSEKIIEATGAQSVSSEEDVREYIDEVIKEIYSNTENKKSV